MDFNGKRSGQIPAFGDWDNANEMPITQYFESATQAGLVRYPSALTAAHQSQCDPYMTNGRGSCGGYPTDPYAADFQRPSVRLVTVPPRKVTGGAAAVNNGESTRRRSCGCPPHVKEQNQQQRQQRIKQHGRLVPVQVNVYDVVDVKQQLPTSRTRSQQLFCNHHHHHHNNNSSNQNQKKQMFPKHTATAASAVNVKPVDEDLYKIPPELLLQHNSKRKKMLGFFSKCLVPPCKA